MSDCRFVEYQGKVPTLGRSAFVADTARIIGDVIMGDACSIWYGAVVRGDVFHIRIGHRVNIQDMAMIHVTTGKHATVIQDDVTIGHRASLHGCTIERGALVGMGATVLDEAIVGRGAMVAAGALVPPATRISPGTLWTGIPARYRRDLSAAEVEHVGRSAAHYCQLAASFLQEGVGNVEESNNVD